MASTSNEPTPLPTLSFRPTSSLRVRSRNVPTPNIQQALTANNEFVSSATAVETSGAFNRNAVVILDGSKSNDTINQNKEGRYFKMMSTRRTYLISTLLALRTKYTMLPPNLPDLICIESGADESLTWGLRVQYGATGSRGRRSDNATNADTNPERRQKRTFGSKSGATGAQSAVAVAAAAAASSMGMSTISGSSGDAMVKPLTQSANRWRPTNVKGFEVVIRKLKGVLNKLTVDKFESLAARYVGITAESCHNEEELRAAVQLVFDKALAETHFGDMYPNLCLLLSQKLPAVKRAPSDNDQSPSTVSFRSIILALCQKEFDLAFRAIVPAANCSPAQLEELRVKQRLRMLGNMQFIGELFKKSMLNAKVVLLCLRQLCFSDPPNSSNLESACMLLSVVGKALDNGSPPVDEVFKRLKLLSTSEAVLLRTRFLLLDLFDLRQSQWVPRRKKIEAMKIDEFRKNADPRGAIRDQRTATTRAGPEFFGVDASGGVSSDCKITSRRSRAVRRPDRYARALNSNSPVGITDSELASRYETRSNEAAGGVPASGDVETVQNVIAEAEPALISESELRRKVRIIVNEYIGITDLNEAIECMAEINQADNTLRSHLVVIEVFNQGIELNVDKERANAVRLVKELFDLSLLNSNHVQYGVEEVLELLPDIVIDLPIAPSRMGEMLGGLIKANCLPASFIKDVNDDDMRAKVFAIAENFLIAA